MPGLCVPVERRQREADTVEVSIQDGDPFWCGVWRCDIQAVPVGRCRVVYCVTVDV
jgi:hypothetical protein